MYSTVLVAIAGLGAEIAKIEHKFGGIASVRGLKYAFDHLLEELGDDDIIFRRQNPDIEPTSAESEDRGTGAASGRVKADITPDSASRVRRSAIELAERTSPGGGSDLQEAIGTIGEAPDTAELDIQKAIDEAVEGEPIAPKGFLEKLAELEIDGKPVVKGVHPTGTVSGTESTDEG